MNTRVLVSSHIKFIQITLLYLIPIMGFAYAPTDSIGIRNENNSTYIIHEVEQGETVYGIARKYKVSPDEIMKLNPGTDNGISIGSELKIPFKGKIQNTQSGQIVHKVKSGETLSSIAEKYQVSVNNIKSWNDMKKNTLSVGQELVIHTSAAYADSYNKDKAVRENNGKKIHIVNKGETLYSISRQYEVSTDDIKDWNRLESNNLYIGQELVVGFNDNTNTVITNQLEVKTDKEADSVKKYDIESKPMTKAEPSPDFKKVTEKGVARVIEGSESTKKYLALHHTAPIGTIMQVRNEMNDLSVFVRVIGKLPDTGENRNLLIKISKTAYDRLNAYDNQFPVEIIYHP